MTGIKILCSLTFCCFRIKKYKKISRGVFQGLFLGAVACRAWSAAATAAAATAAELLDPVLARLLACARRNLQQVSVYLQARVHVSSFWLKPNLMLASPIRSRLIS